MSDDQEAEVADETEADVDETAEETESGLQNGDFIKLAYTARTVEGDDLVDTTDEAVAEEADVEVEDREFSPRTIVLGEGHIFQPVEDDILGKEVGDSGEVVVDAVDAFGEYDESQVRTVKADKIPEDSRFPGAHVDIDGQHGHVETIVGGRARVDFNHALAGEDIEYEYEVVGVVDDPLEKARGLISMYFDADLEMHIETDEVEEEVTVESDDEDEEPETETETVEKETLYIESTQQLQFNQQWMMGKQQILQQVMQQTGIDRVIVQETIDGSGMGGMMGGMGGMMGGMGDEDLGDLEDALEDADVDADEIADELEAADLEE